MADNNGSKIIRINNKSCVRPAAVRLQSSDKNKRLTNLFCSCKNCTARDAGFRGNHEPDKNNGYYVYSGGEKQKDGFIVQEKQVVYNKNLNNITQLDTHPEWGRGHGG